jgi:hypothetical protein
MNEQKKTEKNAGRVALVDPLGLYREKLLKIAVELRDSPPAWLPPEVRPALYNDKNVLSPVLRIAIDYLYKNVFND